MKVLPGSPHPLGATWDGYGVNFALFSLNALAVELCLFDPDGRELRLMLTQRTAYVWHGYVTGVGVGQRYGYRVYGDYDPKSGHRFNPNVVLVDPYARALDGKEDWERGCFAYPLGGSREDLQKLEQPALGAPRGVVIDPSFDWEGDECPRIPMRRSVIYEAHVKGLTQLHPDVPEELRGTYSGVAHPATIAYLKDLGVTAIELMPVHAFVDDKILLDRGLRNYWGYNSIGFFAPDVRYRSSSVLGSEVREFKQMVKALHRAGLEVILDVVYNHTAEGNHLGPTFSFKGIDNATYYRLVPGDPRYYFDYTGTGNTLNVRSPQVLALIMDSLRYWATEMHVDGFRFDLASTLARQLHDVDQLSSFFTLIHQSPDLRDAKLIAEPWDVGAGGYQLGKFPVRWAEWNGRYRDTVRAFWRGDPGMMGDFGYRITGSSDLYESSGRAPANSLNFVTAHDGFTLRDLVSYDHKHNEANGEGNRDGNDHEHSHNYGVEGPTDDPAVRALRSRQQRNLLTTLILAQGTPMLVAGDESGLSQHGNNNAYCQDNELSWVAWQRTPEQQALFEFTKQLIRIRREHPALRRSKFFRSIAASGTDHDLLWFRADGSPMTEAEWRDPEKRTVQMFLAGRGVDDVDDDGRPLVDDNLLLLVNASSQKVEFRLPTVYSVREPWHLVFDTTQENALGNTMKNVSRLELEGRSCAFLLAPSRVVRRVALHRLGATYRLQLTADFPLSRASELVDYLQALGITDLYSSPLLSAARGSSHGYDVVDHTRINPELGGQHALSALSQRLREAGMGLLLDWVPNHMGIAGGENAWWDDVLENGPSSLYSDFFDIDWAPARVDLHNRVLLPILGDQYGTVLERGELKVVWDRATFKLAYWEHRLPLGPKSLLPLLEKTLSLLSLSESDPERQELESISSALRHLPERHDTQPDAKKERAREKEVIKRRLARLLDDVPEVSHAMDLALQLVNGSAGDPSSFDLLDAMLGQQSYRLASWKVAAEEINYRRFFDINELAALSMENPEVFEQAHGLLFQLIHQGDVHALRLDHTDGLYDPDGYFHALQSHFRLPPSAEAPSPDDVARPLPILAEKILQRDEALSPEWPIDGTTGYEFGIAVGGLWVDPGAESRLTRIYQAITGDSRSFHEHEYESKRYIIRFALASEVTMLARAAHEIAMRDRHFRDFTIVGLSRALTEIISFFPVYRTYLRPGSEPSPLAQRVIRSAIRTAIVENPALSPSIFQFFEQLMLPNLHLPPEERKPRLAFALRFQQLTGPIMAKGVEDTAFYRYTRLVSLNEVGGFPGKFGTSIAQFHHENAERARSWPLSMNTTATHDAKRGEDASARISVLSEMPDAWENRVKRWRNMASALRLSVDGVAGPAPAQEYLFYQTLVGSMPYGWDGVQQREELSERIRQYMLKVIREAKTETSWVTSNATYEESSLEFCRIMLGHELFLQDVRAFCRELSPFGALNSLAQTLLKTCSPGVPDTYQGGELWNQSLVDPDNRRPVDFELRRKCLAQLDAAENDKRSLVRELLESFVDGRLKMHVLHQSLLVRRALPELFARGDYLPCEAGEHTVAFARTFERDAVICCAARLTYRMTGGQQPFPRGEAWGSRTMTVPIPGRYLDKLTDRRLKLGSAARLSEIYADLPLALLVREAE